MASPQIENGYTKISNELLEAFSRTNLSSYQFRIVAAILRKTYGWNKKEDWVSISQLISITGIHKSHVCRTQKELIQRRIVTKGGNKIAINKDYTQWRQLPKGATTHHPVTKGGNLELPKGAVTKETLTKEKKKKNTSKKRVTKGGNKKNNIPPTLCLCEYVQMTDDELEKLLSQFGEPNTVKMIDKLDNYKGASGKKYKSDYRAILSWVADEIMGKESKDDAERRRFHQLIHDAAE